jgi:hypothetical protein
VATGKKGLLAYRQNRLSETQKIPNFGDGSCFHDGQHKLQTVCDSHGAAIRSLHKEDTITQRVLERMVDEMLQSEPDTRPSARQLWAKKCRILTDAEADLSGLISMPSAKESMTFPLPHRPPPPPVLPPGLMPPPPPPVRHPVGTPYYYHPHPSHGKSQDSLDPNGARSLSTVRNEGGLFISSEERSYSLDGLIGDEKRRFQPLNLDILDGAISQKLASPTLTKLADSSAHNGGKKGRQRKLSGVQNTDDSTESSISQHSNTGNRPRGWYKGAFSLNENTRGTENSQIQSNSKLTSEQVSRHDLNGCFMNSAPSTQSGYTVRTHFLSRFIVEH